MIFITGVSGYIGSHVALSLVRAGYEVIGIDDFSNSYELLGQRLSDLCGDKLQLLNLDIRNSEELYKILSSRACEGVIHFAAHKSVSDSILKPLDYFDINVSGTLSLLRAMSDAGVNNLVFSSSATVYGDADSVPISEDSAFKSPENPYGRTKQMIENILSDLARSDSKWRIAALRYFNPLGNDLSGCLGEAPRKRAANVLPVLLNCLEGNKEIFSIFGDDYPTSDGTALRDYIHVSDLADGHTLAYEYLIKNSGFRAFNLGSGNGYTVMQLLRAVEEVSGKCVKYKIADRREGDVAASLADIKRAKNELNWEPRFNLTDMVKHALLWRDSILYHELTSVKTVVKNCT